MGDLVVTKHRKVHSKPDDTGTDGEVDDMTLKDKQDVAQSSMVNGSSNGEGSHVQIDSAKPYADGDAREVDTDNMSHKTDCLQELLQLAQEYESVDASKRGLDNGCHPQNEGFNEVSPEEIVEQGICVKEDVKCVSNQKAGMEVFHSEGAELKSTASEKGVSASFSVSQSKTTPTGDQRNLQNKEVRDTGQTHASQNRRSSRSASFSSITIGPSRSHFTIPQPFSLATDKRALGGGRPRDEQVLQKPLGFNGIFEDSHSRTPVVSRKLCAKLPVAKSICSESIKHLDDPLKRLTIRANPEHHDEDAMSISSVRSCSQAPKAKASRFTSTSSFKFQSEARAEQRKEYYLKLQERLGAKEEEMKHMQAKAKKEKEEEIKLLRKSMTFKASPVPSFYQEGPPPKAELPKTPTTRAKSPNFTRRDSHSGFSASTRLCNTIRCEAELRSSLSPQKPGKGNDKEVLGKENQSKRSVGGRSLSASPNEKPAERKTSSSGSASALELLDVEISVSGGGFEDVQVKVRDPLTVSYDLMMSDEEEEAHVGKIAESMHVTSNGEGDKVYVDKIKCSEEASAVNGSIGRPKESNVLKGHGNANAGVLSTNSNNTKADRKVQPLAYEERGLV